MALIPMFSGRSDIVAEELKKLRVWKGGIRTILARNSEATSSTKKQQQRWIAGKKVERVGRGDRFEDQRAKLYSHFNYLRYFGLQNNQSTQGAAAG